MKEGGFLSHLPQKQVVRLGLYPHQWAYPAHTRGDFAGLVAPASPDAGAPPRAPAYFLA